MIYERPFCANKPMTGAIETPAKPRILLLDDDPDVLSTYQQVLMQLPSQPEVSIATSGSGAMAMLEVEPFNLLISDIKMPKMDGLQVITIVRRKFPRLRTVILTAVTDEQMRSRAYALGIDLYLEKPNSSTEVQFFLDCIESLLDDGRTGGFRGVQRKSLADLIQLECLSGSSAVLKVTQGTVEARIWIQNGELIDAATPDQQGEEALRRILSWKTGNFEILPMEAERPRKIMVSFQGLLLDTAQSFDESQAENAHWAPASLENEAAISDTQFFLSAGLGHIKGVEFALKITPDQSIPNQKWGLENPEPLARWIKECVSNFQAMGEKLEFGAVQQFEGRGPLRHVSVTLRGPNIIAVGMLPALEKEQIDQNVQKVLERWAS